MMKFMCKDLTNFGSSSVNILKHLRSCTTGIVTVNHKWFLQCANALARSVCAFQEIIVDLPYLSDLVPNAFRLPCKPIQLQRRYLPPVNTVKKVSPKSQQQFLKRFLKLKKKKKNLKPFKYITSKVNSLKKTIST